MKYVLEINDEKVRKSCGIIEKHIKDFAFYEMIPHEKFNMAESDEVVRTLKSIDLTIVIKPYKTWNPWSNVIAYWDGEFIWLNTRKIGRPTQDILETICHESLHALGFEHRGNKADAYNLHTVPYHLPVIFVKYLKSIGALA